MGLHGLKIAVIVNQGVTTFDAEGADDDVGGLADRDAEVPQLAIVAGRARRKIGILTEADVVGKRLMVRGYLYARDFPEVARAIEAQSPEAMGMSYELADARVEDLRAEIWKLTRVTFTGAAILLRDKAAYRATSFRMTK